MKKVKKKPSFKIVPGKPLAPGQLTELWEYNEDFVEKKRQLFMEHVNKFGGIEKFAARIEERIRKEREAQQ